MAPSAAPGGDEASERDEAPDGDEAPECDEAPEGDEGFIRGAPGASVRGRPLTLEETVRGAEEEVWRAIYAEVPPTVSSEALEAWLDSLRCCEKTQRRARVRYGDVPEPVPSTHLTQPTNLTGV